MSVGTRGLPPDQRRSTIYETYLRTDELLSLQKSLSERLHPDELTFQIVHQTFELWWKLTVEQLGDATSRLQKGQAALAARALRRAVSAASVTRAALRQLELVAPRDFLAIRAGLGSGSGSESPGFRAILRTVPKVWDAYSSLLARSGISLVDLYQEPLSHLDLYECAEALTDFDEEFHLFRAAHLKLAQRNLGLQAIGTGGTPMPALEKTLHDFLFPKLWEARDELLSRTATPAKPSGTSRQVARKAGR